MRAEAKAEAARVRAAEEEEIQRLFEATQEIADLVSRREGRPALQRLNQATARFGDRPELADLRKRIAALLIDG